MGSDELFKKLGKKVPAGTILFRSGDSTEHMFVIHKGKVRISRRAGNEEKTLAILGAGEFFGEMAILNNEPRSATAEAIEECELLPIDPKTFESMIKGNTEIAFRMIKKLAYRLKEADEQIENLMLKDNNSKILNTLIRIGENEGKETEGGIRVSVTTKELSLKTGLDQEKTGDILSRIVKANLISILPDGIIIYNIVKLRKFLDFLTVVDRFEQP